MRLEIEKTQSDFDGMAIMVIATSNEECFELGRMSESLHRDGVKFVQCTDDGVWLRIPLIFKDNAKRIHPHPKDDQ